MVIPSTEEDLLMMVVSQLLFVKGTKERSLLTTNGWSATVLCCAKTLMHISTWNIATQSSPSNICVSTSTKELTRLYSHSSPGCITTAYVASMLVICYLISVTGEECEYSLVSSFVDVLTQIFEGLDWVAIFHVDMCIKVFAQQRTVADHPFVVNSDLSLVPLTNSSCETTIIRRSSSVLGITIFTRPSFKQFFSFLSNFFNSDLFFSRI